MPPSAALSSRPSAITTSRSSASRRAIALVENHSRVLHLQDVSNILTMGGTILGTSREKPHRIPLPHGKTVDLTERAVENYHRLGLDCLVCLGGNGTHKVAHSLMQQGLNVIG